MKGYQNVVLDGVQQGLRRKREKSKFFNEGKWDNFIKPFLPEDCSEMTFVDIGCNNGLFLKLAKEHGFEQILGIDSNEEVCDVARKYAEADVIASEIDESIYDCTNNIINQIPAADYILLANTHYHIYASAFLHFLNLIRRKCRYVILVSADDAKHKLYRAASNSRLVRGCFKNWKEVASIENLDSTGDPTPRQMYSILFKTDIERLKLTDISKGGSYGRSFYRKVKRDMKKDNDRTPQNHPLLLRPDGSVYDGRHRLASLELDGYKTALCEVIHEKD